MMGIHAVPVLPGMDNMTLLQIELGEERIQLRIPSPFVAIGQFHDLVFLPGGIQR